MATKQSEASITGVTHPLTERAWGSYLLWVPAAALIGFAIAAVFTGVFHLPRNIYLIPHVGLVSLFFYAFLLWSGLSVINLVRHNWAWGVIGAVLLGMFTVNYILSQPASARSEGLSLAFEILWVGVVYDLINALLLSILPVLEPVERFRRWAGRKRSARLVSPRIGVGCLLRTSDLPQLC